MAKVGTIDAAIVHGPLAAVNAENRISTYLTLYGNTVSIFSDASVVLGDINTKDVVIVIGTNDNNTTLRDLLETAAVPVVVMHSPHTIPNKGLATLIGLIASEAIDSENIGAADDPTSTHLSFVLESASDHPITRGFDVASTFPLWLDDTSDEDINTVANSSTFSAGTTLMLSPAGLPTLVAADAGDARNALRGGTFAVPMAYCGFGVYSIGNDWPLIQLTHQIAQWAAGNLTGGSLL